MSSCCVHVFMGSIGVDKGVCKYGVCTWRLEVLL